MVKKMQDTEYSELAENFQPPSRQDLEEYENIDYLLEESSSWQYWYDEE